MQPTLRCLPRPLIPLLLFLYRVAKYSHSSLSSFDMVLKSAIEAKRLVSDLSVSAWNLF